MQKNSNKLLSCVTIEPKNEATKCIIWLHGLGADGNDFAPIVPELNIAEALNVRFVFPHAPIIPVTINNGYEMRAWYDIRDTDIASRADKDGIKQSIQQVNDLIQHEIDKGIKPENILLAGFSQGAAIALLTGLSYPTQLAGIVALSGYLPHISELKNKETPIFMAHGTQDQVVPFMLGNQTHEMLEAAGYYVDWHQYPMQHSVCGEEIADLREWLLKVW